MDLGNGPATVWALSCRSEEPTERMGKRTGPRTPADLQMGGGGGNPPYVIMVFNSLMAAGKHSVM